MNFKSELLAKVLAGEKTQTRRPSKRGYALIKGERIAVVSPTRTVYEVGKTYAACPGRGKKQEGRIKIVKLRYEDVRNISPLDVRAEGFNHKGEFLNVWMGFYDKPAQRRVMDDLFSDDAPDTQAKEIREYIMGRNAALYQAWAIDFKLVK